MVVAAEEIAARLEYTAIAAGLLSRAEGTASELGLGQIWCGGRGWARDGCRSDRIGLVDGGERKEQRAREEAQASWA
ncbi:hypothetical protein M0R45_030497 [Rubus argutus]|uniref:Uncharacterized protein n=1 Tax=Rubus argutus TaxID=59490 RepID=A0AAW1WBQ5_RUBAR